MRILSRARWLAVPVATFMAVFAASFAVHAFDGNSEPEDAEAGRSAAPREAKGRERIAVAIRDGESESYIHVLALDGSNRRQVTRPPTGAVANDSLAAWSPDGSTFVLSRQVIEDRANPENPHLYAISPEGTGLRRLTQGAAFDILPAWAPDASRIVFSRVVGEQSTDVFTMRPDGTDVVRLTDDPRVYEDTATYAPDGTRIVYTRVARDNEDVYVMNADGSRKEALLAGPHEDGAPAFAPDGLRIAFVRDGHIAVAEAEGTDVRLLTSGELMDSHPQWSPDGTRILFTRDPGAIYVMNADGSGLARVPIDGQASGASWEPAP